MECWLFKEWSNKSGISSLGRWFDRSSGCEGFLVGYIESEVVRSWLVFERSYGSIRSFIEWKITVVNFMNNEKRS